MNITFICAVCGERMVAKTDKIPEYCPFCGAHKMMARSRKVDSKTVEERLAEYDAAKAVYDTKYREFCLVYYDYFRAYNRLQTLATRGKLARERLPKMPKMAIMRDSRYFYELEQANARDNESTDDNW